VAKSWIEWHKDYDDPSSALSERRRQVTRLVREWLNGVQVGPVRVLSLCGGDARDLADALTDHRRVDDVEGAVVELEPQLAISAASHFRQTGARIEVIIGDAGNIATFKHVLPVDLLMLVGIFGNVSAGDVETMIKAVPALCKQAATVIWTRHRRPPDLVPSVREWFDSAGCTPVDFISPGKGQFAVGCEKVGRATTSVSSSARLFTFLD
jgi:hypothetical protein